MFALIDCNNFYASCERLFRPDLRGVPIVVLSNNDGCCIARSDEAKELGIPIGAPYFEIKKLCKKYKMKVFSSNYTLYGDISHRVMLTIKNSWPEVQIYSIDEAFLDLRTLPKNQIDDFCRNLQKTILQHTGIITSIGVGQTKTLAKAANYLARKVYKCPVFNISKNTNAFLKEIALADVWGVGNGWWNKLKALGINTAYDLAYMDEILLRTLSNVVLTKTSSELKGNICNELEAPKLKQNIMSSKSFGFMQTELSEIEEAISSYCARVVQKMRGEKLLARKIHVFVKTNRHRIDLLQYNESIDIKFIFPTDDLRLITKTATHCLRRIFKQGFFYKKAGVMLCDLIPNHITQFDLFSHVQDSQNLKAKRFMDLFDKINEKYGRNTARLASEGFDKKWSMRSDMKSPAYTTRWEELPNVIVR